MGGALPVAAYGFSKLPHGPACARSFQLPAKRSVDNKLLAGALLFGAGWGLGGMCPGPILVNLGGNASQPVVIVATSMLAGMWAHGKLEGMYPAFFQGGRAGGEEFMR
mmetsp:Transcript_17644/g.57096  ORF Transcript_17644/g.57096 Transcript_17644/m.57096 type:complete len:108 (+) Transcript_17644:188-511(+)